MSVVCQQEEELERREGLKRPNVQYRTLWVIIQKVETRRTSSLLMIISKNAC